jgi:CubicO group peptidase (beta-lactamase class C family)
MINLFRDLPLLCEPGEAWNYSNFGYYLLGWIIESISGVSYDEFLKKNIFEPLNMKDTRVERDKKIIQGLATGYYLNDDELIRFKYMDIDLALGSGDMHSTVEDMLLWDKALYTEDLVSKNTLDLIFTPYANSGETGSEDNDYGYGWFIEKKYGRNRISHGGGGLGFITEFHRYVNEEVSIVVLKLYESYIGTYKDNTEKLTVGQDNGKMFFVIDDEYIIPMFPISENQFHHTWIDESYRFSKDENGDHWFCGMKKQE